MNPSPFIPTIQLADKLARCKVVQRVVDPVLVVVYKGLCQNGLGILEARKTVWPHILLLERHVERLRVSVLFWRVLPDELVSYSQHLG